MSPSGLPQSPPDSPSLPQTPCLPTDLHAVVADAAVRAARRSVEVAGRAPLHAHLHAVHVGVLVQRCAEVVVLVLVLVGCGSTGLESARVYQWPTAGKSVFSEL